jgi:lysophospholipase L1-like esterase
MEEGRWGAQSRVIAGLVAASLTLLGAVDRANAEPAGPGFAPASIEDPSGHALDHFFAALSRTESKAPGAITRIAHYGDSYIVSDQITHTVRALYQHRYGDAGPGFVLAGRPWEWYRREGVNLGASAGWDAYRSSSGGPADGFFGYGGATFVTKQPHRRIWFETTDTAEGPAKASSIDLHYLAQPGGGDVQVLVDGEHQLTISTAGEDAHSAFLRLDVPDGHHEFVLETDGGAVRLFGAALERSGPGVVYDALGINGACATVLTRINAQHWAQQLAHRHLDLVIVAYGANESNRPDLVANYREHLQPILQEIRQGTGGASCLVVSPLDRGERLADGSVRSNPNVARIVARQREAAAAAGCGFFNTYEAMGGDTAMLRWSRAGLASSDLTHPTPEGAELIGRGLFEALERAFATYRDAHVTQASR